MWSFCMADVRVRPLVPPKLWYEIVIRFSCNYVSFVRVFWALLGGRCGGSVVFESKRKKVDTIKVHA